MCFFEFRLCLLPCMHAAIPSPCTSIETSCMIVTVTNMSQCLKMPIDDTLPCNQYLVIIELVTSQNRGTTHHWSKLAHQATDTS